MDGLAASAFSITSAALMGYSFALLLVVKKKEENKQHKGLASVLPLFPLLFILYFALENFALAKEAVGVLALLFIFYVGYQALTEVYYK